MDLRMRAVAWAVGMVVAIAPHLRAADLSSDAVRKAIQKGVGYLKKQQRVDGSWPGHPGQPGGLTSLCCLALLNAGEKANSPAVDRALTYLRNLPMPSTTYAIALQTMAFTTADPDRDRLLIRRNAKWLQSAQVTSGKNAGAWGYGNASGRVDNSNTQFAMLALHESERVGVRIEKIVWQRAYAYWTSTQNADGSWSYFKSIPPQQPTGSMTCAGIASLIIASGKLNDGSSQVRGEDVLCCGKRKDDQNLQRALDWLGRKFSVNRNPGMRHFMLYYLYGVERVGRLSSRRYIGKHDWYREGADKLVREQDKLTGYWRGSGFIESNTIVATSFSVLFLSKGLRPVVMAKVRYPAPIGATENHWDLHSGGAHKLTQRLEKRWQRDLTWQTIDIRSANVDQLLQAPVLFLSGRDSLQLSDQQIQNLRQYVDQGGFIFAERCCNGKGFDEDFRRVIKKMFPESGLRLLPPDHPVWYAEQKVDPQYLNHIYGVDACCRTSVVYVPRDLSCYWQLHQEGRRSDYPPKVQAEIEACLRIGANVIAYATNRELKDKLSRPNVTYRAAGERLARGTLYVPKLSHSGGADDAPNALGNLLRVLRGEVQMRVNQEQRLIATTDADLFDYPVVFMHGRRSFRFSAVQRKSLGRYLREGGVLMADAICASPAFAASFRKEMAAIFPDAKLTRVPPSHALFTNQYKGFSLSSVTVRDPQARRGDDPLRSRLVSTTPLLEGIEIDGRLAVVFSPIDISCALENNASLECKSYIREDAARIGVNVILYALQQ